MTNMGKARGPFGGSSHSSASAQDVWAVWTNAAEWPGDVIVMAKIDGPFAVGAKITMRVKGQPAAEIDRHPSRSADVVDGSGESARIDRDHRSSHRAH